jgi:hypothetical protein
MIVYDCRTVKIYDEDDAHTLDGMHRAVAPFEN